MEIEKGFIHNRQITDEERERSKAKGQYDISPNPLSAGGPQEVTLTYTAGPEGIKPGGGLKVEVPQVWFKPQLDDAKGAGYAAYPDWKRMNTRLPSPGTRYGSITSRLPSGRGS